MPVLLALSLLFLPPVAEALAVSNAEVNSRLNQILDARIPVLFANQEELDSLRVTIRTENGDALALRHELVREEGGGAYLSVSSGMPVNEPWIGFSLELVWSGGRTVREYVLLIHPPNCQGEC